MCLPYGRGAAAPELHTVLPNHTSSSASWNPRLAPKVLRIHFQSFYQSFCGKEKWIGWRKDQFLFTVTRFQVEPFSLKSYCLTSWFFITQCLKQWCNMTFRLYIPHPMIWNPKSLWVYGGTFWMCSQKNSCKYPKLKNLQNLKYFWSVPSILVEGHWPCGVNKSSRSTCPNHAPPPYRHCLLSPDAAAVMWQEGAHQLCLTHHLTSPTASQCLSRSLENPPTRQVEQPLTSTLEEVAVDILDGGVDGRPRRDTARSDVRVILGIDVLKSFPWNSRMEFCLRKQGCILKHLHTASWHLKKIFFFFTVSGN
jgi:hypothetical protein